MAAPPPPPPPGPPIPVFSSKSNQDDGRSMLLESIRKGTKLKKAVTIDKSAPLIAGNSVNKTCQSTNTSTTSRNDGNNRANDPPPVAAGLGGLFVNGIPKLKATGLPIGQVYQQYRNENDASKSNSTINNNLSNNASRQKMINNSSGSNGISSSNNHTSSLTKLRGPPPQPPGLPPKLTTLDGDALSGLPAHARSGSAISLSENSYQNRVLEDGQQQVISHGKPSLAPRPPSITNKIDGRPSVSRTQSMRNPRTSISVSEINKNGPLFNDPPEANRMTSKNGYPSFHQSQESLSLNRRSNRSTSPNRTPSNAVSWGSSLNTASATLRPHNRVLGSPLRPPLAKPPPPPSTRSAMCPPMCPPPPPPSHAPPPPPHRLNPAPPPPPYVVQNRHGNNNFTNSGAPPQPPIRNSSMRSSNSNEMSAFEARFMSYFHSVDEFSAPQPFQNVPKIYNSKIQAKQQAPQPPIKSALHTNRTWQTGENVSKC